MRRVADCEIIVADMPNGDFLYLPETEMEAGTQTHPRVWFHEEGIETVSLSLGELLFPEKKPSDVPAIYYFRTETELRLGDQVRSKGCFRRGRSTEAVVYIPGQSNRNPWLESGQLGQVVLENKNGSARFLMVQLNLSRPELSKSSHFVSRGHIPAEVREKWENYSEENE